MLLDVDTGFVQLMHTAFERRGWDVFCARTARQGLQIGAGKKFDCVVVDPFLAGPGWIRFLRALSGQQFDAQILVVTGHPSKAMANACHEAGVASYLARPVAFKTLLGAVEGRLPKEQRFHLHRTPITLWQAEWEHINQTLAVCSGNVSQAADRLGISRQGLYAKLGKHPPHRQATRTI